MRPPAALGPPSSRATGAETHRRSDRREAVRRSDRAVFLDRDGVVNDVVFRDGAPASPRSLDEFTIRDEAPAAIERLRRAGFRVFVVTNQPDVARGLMAPERLTAMTERLRARLPVDDCRACTHDDADGCGCRKPKPGMLHALAAEWAVDLSASYMIGDSWKDMDAGCAAGCETVLLRRGYNSGARADHEAETLAEAAALILESGADRSRMPYAERHLEETRRILERLDPAALEAMARALADVREREGRLFFLGAGGGAAHASHAAGDFRKIAGLECYAPADNVAELTARTNDDGWETVFAEYLRGSGLGSRDGVFVFSVGGGDAERGVSANIVRALELAESVDATIFGIVGRDGGRTARVADHCIVVPTVNPETVTPHTEAFQAVLWHLLVSHPALQRFGMKWETVAAAGAR